MKVFSKKKFMEKRKVSACDEKWVNQCDGKTPAECFPYSISDEWCVDVPDDMREKAREFVEKPLCDVAKLLRDIESQDVNCRWSDVSMHPRYKIVIEGYKNTTLATMYVDDNVIKRTAAKRHPADKFNWRIGAQTAFNRLWEKKNKPVVREVKRHTKPGEWVKVVNATKDSSNECENGDVLLIVPYTGTSTFEYSHYKDKDTKFLYDDEYVVLEGYKPE